MKYPKSFAIFCMPFIWLMSGKTLAAQGDALPLLVYTESSPPYQYLDSDGEVAGIASQSVRQIIRQAGYDGTFLMVPWARAMHLTRQSSRGLIYSMAQTPERLNRYQWIAPVVTFRLSLVALTARSDIDLSDLSQLAQYTFAVQREDIAHQWLLEQGLEEGKQMLVCADIECSWRYLLDNKVDLIIEDPNLAEAAALTLGENVDLIREVMPIPELTVVGYLAASHTMPPYVVEQLRKAAIDLGFDSQSD